MYSAYSMIIGLWIYIYDNTMWFCWPQWIESLLPSSFCSKLLWFFRIVLSVPLSLSYSHTHCVCVGFHISFMIAYVILWRLSLVWWRWHWFYKCFNIHRCLNFENLFFSNILHPDYSFTSQPLYISPLTEIHSSSILFRKGQAIRDNN